MENNLSFFSFFHLKTCRDLIQTSLAAENKADQSCSPRGGCQAVAVAKRFAARIRFSTWSATRLTNKGRNLYLAARVGSLCLCHICILDLFPAILLFVHHSSSLSALCLYDVCVSVWCACAARVTVDNNGCSRLIIHSICQVEELNKENKTKGKTLNWPLQNSKIKVKTCLRVGHTFHS